MGFKINGIAKCIDKFGKIGTVPVGPVILKGAQRVQRRAKIIVARDTGYLGRSIKYRPYENSYNKGAEIYTPVEYGVYIEFGTTKMRAQPFLRPAFLAESKTIINELNKFLVDRLVKITRR